MTFLLKQTEFFFIKANIRIMLAGSDDHVFAKSTPKELQLEKSVMPPTPEHVRVQTPPR